MHKLSRSRSYHAGARRRGRRRPRSLPSRPSSLRPHAASAPRRAPDYVPGEVLVGYASASGPAAVGGRAHHARDGRSRGRRASTPRRRARLEPAEQVIHVPAGRSIVAGDRAARAASAGRRLRGPELHRPRRRLVLPNDPGRAHQRRRLAADCSGTSSPPPASTPRRRGRTCSPTTAPAARGVVIAVLDTGVAYRNWRSSASRPTSAAPSSSTRTTSSPATRFPLDREGHGTFVAGDDRRGDQQRLRADRPRLRRVDHAGPGARRRRRTATRRRSRAGSATRSSTAPR